MLTNPADFHSTFCCESLTCSLPGKWRIFFLYALLMLSAACQHTPSENQKHQSANFPDIALISDSLNIKYAQGFTIEYGPSFKIVHILKPFQDVADTLSYLLLSHNTAVPEPYQDLPVINIPLQKLIVLSTTHLGLVEALESNDILQGVANTEFLCNLDLRQKAARNQLISVGEDNTLNSERIISAHPDLLMASGMQSATFRQYTVLQQAGIPVMVNSEWLENTLLGRGEWIKLMGALLNKEKEANIYFNHIETEYNKLKTLAASVPEKDRVSAISSMPYKGTWYVPGGNSYLAHLLYDAGAKYHWSDSPESGSLSFDFETVYPVALQANFWFPGDLITSKNDLRERDSRFSSFKSFKTGQVYINNKRMCEGGGNAYWTSGVVNPHLILADYIKAFYPQLLPDYELYYHNRVEY